MNDSVDSGHVTIGHVNKVIEEAEALMERSGASVAGRGTLRGVYRTLVQGLAQYDITLSATGSVSEDALFEGLLPESLMGVFLKFEAEFQKYRTSAIESC
ncbi:MAG: hypothetical protein HZB12_03405 [Candidatus Yonathbacteria bacterium]|nr:hypothetical protein [Candidatus Yonathbacteria bacterium]